MVDMSEVSENPVNGKEEQASTPVDESVVPVTEEPVEERDELVERLRAEVVEAQDKYLRQVAEFQNYRRRTEQEKLMQVQLGKVLVIQELLDVMDDFERAREAATKLGPETSPEQAYPVLKEGLELVFKKFSETLSRLGVQPIEAVGQPFHENEHEAMMQQPAPEGTQPGTVVAEFQKGYRLGDRVLRHARVVVAS